LSSVVLPAPRKPVSRTTGHGAIVLCPRLTASTGHVLLQYNITCDKKGPYVPVKLQVRVPDRDTILGRHAEQSGSHDGY
jgi:hypothetical protein